MVPLKFLGNSWTTIEMPSISCEIHLLLKWSKKHILDAGTAAN